MRAYGWRKNEAGAVEIVPDEADQIRRMQQYIVGGGSFRALAEQLTADNVPTVTGRNGWSPTTLKAILTHPRLASLRQLSTGEYISTARPPILTRPEWDALQQSIQGGSRDTPRTRVGHPSLLDGVIRCGVCGTDLVAASQGKGQTAYRCNKSLGGCGGVTVSRDMVDNEVESRVLVQLVSPDVVGRLRKATTATAIRKREERIQGIDDRLTELGVAYSAGKVDVATLTEATERMRAERAKLTEEQAAAAVVVSLPEPTVTAVADWWALLPIRTRQDVVRTFITRIDVAASGSGRRRNVINRLDIHWAD